MVLVEQRDVDFVAVCDEFCRAHAEWVFCADSLSDDQFNQACLQAPGVSKLATLRAAWVTALEQIWEYEPVSLSGACAKWRAAYALLSWAGVGDGYITAFFIKASADLDVVLSCTELFSEDGAATQDELHTL